MHVLAALLLALIPPVMPIPVELELCMLRAEICADDAAPDTGNADTVKYCLEVAETCPAY